MARLGWGAGPFVRSSTAAIRPRWVGKNLGAGHMPNTYTILYDGRELTLTPEHYAGLLDGTWSPELLEDE